MPGPVERGKPYSEVKPFPEMHSVVTDPDLEIVQVTTDLEQAGDARSGRFTPDGKRFIFKRRDADHKNDYWCLCDIADGWRLRNITMPEDNPRAPFVDGDGRFMYYFQDFSREADPRICLRRVDLEDFRDEEVTVFDAEVDGVGRRPRAGARNNAGMTQGASLRSDGRRVCTGFDFADEDGTSHFAPVIIDLETLQIRGFDWEPYSWRVGGTYFRGDDPEHRGHLLMGKTYCDQWWDEEGEHRVYHSDIHRGSLHVVDEEGSILATVPIGGEDGEGLDHPCWRGGRYQVVCHSQDFVSAPHLRITIRAATPVPCAPEHYQSGKEIPGGRSIDLTRNYIRPDVCHQSWHVDGVHAVFDTEGWAGRGTDALQGPAAFLYLGRVVEEPGEDPCIVTRYLLHPRSSWNWAGTENCPALSPDLKTVMFNSDWTCRPGRPQLFAVRGFSFPEP